MLKWLILILELIIFFYIYSFGANGSKKINLFKQQVSELNIEITRLNKDIENLEEEFKQITEDTDNFYKEKIAREQLQLAMPHDEIYIINKIKKE